MDSEIKVSVCVVTYNQEKYIAECLQSLVDQITDFKFEIIVSDDCSKDNTRAIISDFHNRYPEIIRPIFRESNLGGSENYIQTHALAVGKYIAHIDGDDYSLPGKLQIGADFLDNNPNCNMTFHAMNYIKDGNEYEKKCINEEVASKRFYRKDIIEYIAIGANSSKMYRSNLRNIKLPDFELVDYTANVIQIGDGYAAYCSNKPLGVYRQGVGVSGSHNVNMAVYNSLLFFMKEFPQHIPEINTSAWAWFLTNLKHNKKTKWMFFSLIIKTKSLKGLFKYFYTRKFRKELSGI